MKKIHLIFLILVFAIISCDKPAFEKPKHLINEKQMIEMLVDVHLADATYLQMRNDSIVKKSSATNFYYSVLEKYHVPDSVFEQSFVFYASNPKQFEKMYREVMTKLSEIEQQFSGRKEELEFELPKK
jgi:hypothetical protein